MDPDIEIFSFEEKMSIVKEFTYNQSRHHLRNADEL